MTTEWPVPESGTPGEVRSRAGAAGPADGAAGREPGLTIGAVERETGLSKDTLRVWERRYGFPRPGRDAFGERTYSQDELDRLRLIRRLIDAGHRPGRIVRMPAGELQALCAASGAGAAQSATDPLRPDLVPYVDLVRMHRTDSLRNALSQAVVRMGLGRFVVDVCAPLNRVVGNAWACGALDVGEEHLYTEAMQAVLRNAIGSIPEPGSRPRVLLTTFPNEAHGLGLLMAEAILALEGCRCTSLGTGTPVAAIAKAAAAQQTDIVGLSFTACMNSNQVLDGLAQLRARVGDDVEIWAGGRCPVLRRRAPARVAVFDELGEIPAALGAWRARASSR